MKRKVCCFLMMLLLLGKLGLQASAEELLIGLKKQDEFDCTAQACIVMEAESGRVLYGKEIHKRLPMASTTKIMGALLVLEQENLDEVFSVDAKAIQVEGSSMGLQPGDKVSLRSLAYGMILPSGNDAANAAGVRVYGSVEAFVEAMNCKAQELELEDTHYVTACGLDAQSHYSSAFDLARLTKIAMENQEFALICSQSQARVVFGNPAFPRLLKNHNRLLALYPDCIGVKTGFTDAAGRCLVSAARREGMTLLCVTLHAADDWNLHSSLYERYWKEISQRNLSEFLPHAEVSVVGSFEERVALRLDWEAKLPLRPGEAEEIRCEILAKPFVYAPVKRGDVLGEAVFRLRGELLCRVPLTAQEELARTK